MGKDQSDARPQGVSVVEEFDNDLERFEKGLEALAVRLEPISTGHIGEESDIARPEAETELRSRLERLRILLDRFENIQDQIDL